MVKLRGWGSIFPFSVIVKIQVEIVVLLAMGDVCRLRRLPVLQEEVWGRAEGTPGKSLYRTRSSAVALDMGGEHRNGRSW